MNRKHKAEWDLPNEVNDFISYSLFPNTLFILLSTK